MKHVPLLSLLLMGLTALQISFGQVDTITILHVNDTHSNLAAIGPRDNTTLEGTLGGIARAATYFGMTRTSNPNVLLLHAGDAFIGDLFYNTYFGVAELQMMAALGFDAMAVGNHEFDLTPQMLKMALDSGFAQGGFPLLSANLHLDNSEVQQLKQYIQPYTIKQAGNVKVGIFGLTTPATNDLSQPSPAWVDSSLVEDAARWVDTLNAKGCQCIILLSHLGITLDQAVASYVPGINVIVGGHDHYEYPAPVKILNPLGDTTYIVQANAFYLNAGKLRMTIGTAGAKFLDYEYVKLDQTIPEEPTIAGMVDMLIAGIEATYGQVFTKRIGYAKEDFFEVAISPMDDGNQDTPIGNLVTDAFRAATGTEIAIEAGGSTAQPIYKGPIVAADLFRVVGYGFNTENGLGYHLATFTMKGSDLVAGLEFGLSTIEENDEFFMQSSGLTYTYNAHRPQYQRVVSAFVGDQPLEPEREYTVTANEFVPLSLGFLGIPFSSLHVCTGDTTEFQVLVAYVAAQDTIEPTRRGSIISPVAEILNSVPSTIVLYQNYPNPFNPETVISYELSVPSLVKLVVYDLIGREVATLVNENKQAGTYRVRWDASKMPSGTYFYQLESSGVRLVRKLVLLK